MSRKANRARNRAVRTITELGLKVTTIGNEITLETASNVIPMARKNRDLAWLAADVFSTDSGYRS